MTSDLIALCASHGIEPTYIAFDGTEHAVPGQTLSALAEIFDLRYQAPHPPASINEALAENNPLRCYLTQGLAKRRVWGVTCQLPALASGRNLGMGDFADLAEFCRLAAAEGADFVGTNPLHAMFWSAPERVSPFSPSNRRFLNPLYLAPEWIPGFSGLTAEEEARAALLRCTALIDMPAVAHLKQRILDRCFSNFPWTSAQRAGFRAFCAARGEALEAHAQFEALSEAMTRRGLGPGWTCWPAELHDRTSTSVRTFAANHGERISFQLWLQWQAANQLARVKQVARSAGMRIGLYLDMAVGETPDSSATWTRPEVTVPEVSIGAPPDELSLRGQDWGLAPLSPIYLAERDDRPFADAVAAVMHHAGAVRIDHAMSVVRLWLFPRGAAATEGAYVRYPLQRLLARLAESSRNARTAVVGEDLGVVPQGFRTLMAQRRLHSYKVFFLEADKADPSFLAGWPRDALACFATHDMPTFTGWWTGADIELYRALGSMTAEEQHRRLWERDAKRRAFARRFGARSMERLSTLLHGAIARAPCRLMALQVEDALGVAEQINVPGTVEEYPNWRHRLPIPLERLAVHPGWCAHTAAMRQARP